MPRDGSGNYSLPAGNPVIAGADISSTVHNSTMSDVATALTASLTKDGQAVATANQPMGGYKHTNTAVASARTDYARASQVQDNALAYLTSVSGTNTITATGAVSVAAYAAGMAFEFIPANSNTGAATLNVNSIGAKNIYANGEALVGYELRANEPTRVIYDGTRFHLLTQPSVLRAEQASTSGTAVNFTGIPAWARKLTVMLNGVSENTGDNLVIQIGDSGGLETSGYLGASWAITDAAATAVSAFTNGFGVRLGAAGAVVHGALTITLEDASDNTWVAAGTFARSDAARGISTAGSKSLSATLDRVSVILSGAGNFDAGAISLRVER